MKPDSWLEVVVIATRNRRQYEPRIVIDCCEDRLIEVDQILNRLAWVFISQSKRQREVWSDSPLVLAIEEEVVPVVVEHLRCSGQVFVDVCSRGEVFYQKVQRSVLEQSARSWLEELMQLVPANINTKLPGVITGWCKRCCPEVDKCFAPGSAAGSRQARSLCALDQH